MRSCRRDGCSVAQGPDRTGTVTVTVTVGGRVDRSYRIPCTLCGATTCDRRRLEAGQEKGRQVEKGFKHWQPISSFPNCNTQPWQRAKKLDVPGHFNAGPGAKTLSLLSHAMSKQRPSVPPTLWQMAGTCHGWDMSWRVGQFDNTEAASQVTSPLSVGGKRPRIFSGSTFPVGDRPSSLGKEELDTGTIFRSDDSKHWPKPACLNLDFWASGGSARLY